MESFGKGGVENGLMVEIGTRHTADGTALEPDGSRWWFLRYIRLPGHAGLAHQYLQLPPVKALSARGQYVWLMGQGPGLIIAHLPVAKAFAV